MLDTKPPLPHFPAQCYLVGGAVRDWLSGHLAKDYDWLSPNPAQSAQDFATAEGKSAFCMDPTFNIWRVITSEGIQHDFAAVQSDLLQDLARRDFTINAMALEATSDGSYQLIDPHHGQRDLSIRQLRMVSIDNLHQDPLRALRGVRISQSKGLSIEISTLHAIHEVGLLQLAGKLTIPAWERVGSELNIIMQHKNAATSWHHLEALELMAVYLPELLDGRGVRQGGYHHLDVLDHNIEALNQLLLVFPDASLTLRWATLFHDIGKPRCTSWDAERQYFRFFNHDHVGAAMAQEIMLKLAYGHDMANQVSALIKAHMLPLPDNERAARRFVHRYHDILPDILKLMLADREASRGPLSDPNSHLEYQHQMDLILQVLNEVPTPRTKPLLNGHRIMELLHWPAGQQIGLILAELSELRALGDLLSSEEAEAYVLKHYGTPTQH